jgi:hypothetical protein
MDPSRVGVHGEFGDHRTLLRCQVEADRAVGRGGHVGYLPGVVAVPQKEALDDLLRIGGCQLTVMLAVDQGERAAIAVVVLPGMHLLTVMMAPSAHPVVARAWCAIYLLGRRRGRLGLRQNRTRGDSSDHESRGSGENGLAHSMSPWSATGAYMGHRGDDNPLGLATNCKKVQRSFRRGLPWLM